METSQSIPSFEEFMQAILNWPLRTQIGFLIAVILWLIGGNLLVYTSMKRRGIPYWKSFLPTPSAFRATFSLNKREWFILFVLAVASLSFGMWGITSA